MKFNLTLILTLSMLMTNITAKANFYITTSNGAWSSPSTWQGGFVPPANLVGHSVNISHNVSLDANIIIDATSSISFNGGSITGTNYYMALVGTGSLTGNNATITVDSIHFDRKVYSGIFGITINAKKASMDGTEFMNTPTLNFDTIYIGGSYAFAIIPSTVTFTLTQNTVIILDGASLSYSPPLQTPPPPPIKIGSLIYVNRPATFDEWLASKADTVEIAVANNYPVSLNATATINGVLRLKSGNLSLAGNTLIFSSNSDMTVTNGSIKGSSTSSIRIQNNTGLSGALKMSSTTDTLSEFETSIAITTNAVTLGSSIVITKELLLDMGTIDLNNNSVSLQSGATTKNASINSYLITSNGGELKQDLAANEQKSYPIGTSSAYAPIDIQSNNGTTYSGLSARVTDGVKTLGTSGTDMAATQPMVNHTWFIANNNIKTDINIKPSWTSAQENNNFNRNSCYVSHLNGAQWDATSPSAATGANLYASSRSNVETTGAFAVFDDKAVSVKELKQNNTATLHPNPATHNININYNGKSEVTATLYNLAGALIKTVSISKGKNRINVSGLNSGIYFIRLNADKTTTVHKFVKR